MGFGVEFAVVLGEPDRDCLAGINDPLVWSG